MKLELNKIAKLFIESFDMDIQIFLKNIYNKLGQTNTGENIIIWAKSNPKKFNVILHLISIAIQRIPETNSILLITVKNQLRRLPAEVLGIVDNYVETPLTKITSNDFESYALSDGAKIIKQWEAANIDRNKSKISFHEFLNTAPKAVSELGFAMKEWFDSGNTYKELESGALNILENHETQKSLLEAAKKRRPDLTDEEINAALNSEDFNDMKERIVSAILDFPNLLIKVSTDLENIHKDILAKINGKSNKEAIDIYESEYRKIIMDSIQNVMNNDNLDTERKQKKIDEYIKIYGQIIESVENFK